MPQDENNLPFSIQKGQSPYESAIRTGWSSEHYHSVATGEFTSSATATTPQRPIEPDRSPQRRRQRAQSGQSPEGRAAMRTHWRTAHDAAEAMMGAATAQEPMALAIAADNLDMALARLWDLRDQRDINWQGILNHAQGLVKQLFVEKRVEQLTADQCRHIVDLVENYLGPSTKTTADLNEAIRTIRDAGCDPYWAISGEAADANDAAMPA